MLTIKPSRYGRPGDLIVATVHAPLVASALIVPTKTFDGQPVFDLGLGLEQADLVELRAAMLKAFRGAYPTVKDIPKLPIRPSGRTDVLWVETFKPTVCLDADDRPTDPPTVGTMIKVLFRACPYSRQGRCGVGAYLVKLKLAPDTSAVSERALAAVTRPRIGFDHPSVLTTTSTMRH